MGQYNHAPDDRTAPNRVAPGSTRGLQGISSVQEVFSERPPPRLANRDRELAGDQAQIGFATVETSVAHTPGVFLADVAQALAQRDGLWLVTGTREVAVKVIDLLEQPVQRTADRGARLYKTRDSLRTDDGAIVVQPSSADPATWVLTPAGELRLRAGGQSVGTIAGPPADRIDTVDLPRVTEPAPDAETTVWTVTDAAGETITTYTDRSTLLDDWQRVHAGLVPTRLTYVDAVRVLRPSPDGPALTPCWLRNDLKDDARAFADSVRTFLNLYTVQRADERLPLDTVMDWWGAWHCALVGESPPGVEWFHVGLSPDVDIVERGDTRWLSDRTWAYPCGDAWR